MSRPTSSIRYGTCAVHHTLPSHAVAICSAKRSPFTDAAIPPRGSVDPLEMVGFAADSPPDLPPPQPPSELSDNAAMARWMLMTGRRRMSTSNDNSSSTFGVGRGCRAFPGGPSSTLSCYARRTTGTGPVSVGRCGPQPGNGDVGEGLFCRTDSAPLPLSDYDDDGQAVPVDERLLPSPSVAPSAGATTPSSRCERERESGAAEDCRSPMKYYPRQLTTTTSVAVCRL